MILFFLGFLPKNQFSCLGGFHRFRENVKWEKNREKQKSEIFGPMQKNLVLPEQQKTKKIDSKQSNFDECW